MDNKATIKVIEDIINLYFIKCGETYYPHLNEADICSAFVSYAENANIKWHITKKDMVRAELRSLTRGAKK